MSRVVDERVVEMEFDNQEFERNIQTSISSVERLQNSLKMDGASNGLKNVEKAANEISLDKIATGVESLQNRFSTLGIVGMRAIENITDSIMRLATKTISFLTNGIIQGGINRALNIENAHFQLQGLLKDEEKVQAVMQDAMDSVDGTAYAYDSAAKAAAQFAASGMQAGTEMQSALGAITGVAAMTNSEYEGISQIFTTVAGNGRLMGEQLLQLASRGLNAAATLADYLTEVGDGTKVTEAEVREMVSDGKISFELFAQAMDSAFGEHAKRANETFNGAMSNIKAALARIGALFVSPLVVQNGPLVQLFNAIRERVNDVKEAIGPLADQFTGSVNKMAESAKAAITRISSTDSIKIFSNIVSALVNTFSGLWSILAPIGRAFRDIFPVATAENLISFTNKLKEMTAKLKLGCQEAYNLRKTFKGVFSVVKLVADAFIAVVKGIGSLLSKLTGVRGGFLDITGAMGQWLTETSEAIRETGAFEAIIGGLSEYLGKCVENIKDFVRAANEKFISPGFDNLLGLMQKLGEIVGKIGSKISEFFKGIGEAFNGSSLNGAFTMMGTLILLKTAYKKFFDDWIPVIKRWKSIMLDGFLGTLESVIKAPEGIISAFNALKSSLWTFNKSMKYDNIMKLSKALLILAAAMLIISLIDKDKMAASLTVMTALIAELMGVLKVYDVLGTAKITDSISMTAAATSMIMMAIAVTILASALKKMSGLSVGEMITGISGVTALVAVLVAASKIMSKNQKALTKFGGQMLIMSTAVVILASACEKLSKLSIEELGKGVGGVVALVGTFVAAAKILNDNSASITKFAGQMLIMSAGIAIMAKVCESLSALSWDELLRGGAGLLGVTTILVSAAKIMAKGGSAKGAGQMVLMAASIAVLGKALTNLSGMGWDQIIRGLAAIGASIVILAVGLKAMNGTLAGSAALLVAAAALLVLTPVLSTLGSMSLGAIVKSIVALAAAFVVLGVAGAVLTPLAPAILTLSAAIALMGAGMLMAGVGITAMAAGLASLAAAGTVSATAIASVVSAIIIGIIELIPTIAVKIGEGIIAIAQTIADGAKTLADSALTVVIEILDTLVEKTPIIIDRLCQFVIKIFEGLTQRTPEMVDAAIKFITTLFASIFDSLSSIEADMAEKAGKGILAVVAIVGGLALINPLITSAMAAVAKLAALVAEIGLIFTAFGALSKIPGLMELIEDGGNLLAKIGYAIGDFIGSIIGGFGAGLTSGLPEIGANLSAFATNVEPFVTGVKSVTGNVLTGTKTLAKAILAITGADVVNSIASWLTGGNSIEEFAEGLIPLGEAMAGFSDKVKGMDADVAAKAAAIAETLVSLAAAIPKTDGLAGLFGGSNDLKSFGSKLESFGASLSAYSKNVQGVDANKVNEATSCVRSIVTLIKNIQSVDASTLSNFSLALSKAATVSIKNFISAFDSGKKSASAAVTSMLTTIQKALDSAVEGIREYRDDFNQAGKDVAQGFILGIKSKLSSASSAGWNLGRAALIAAKKALDSHSPSKEFIALGKNIGEGMVIGINNGIVPVTWAAAKMSNAAIEASKQGLESFQTWLEEKKYYSEISLKEELAGWEALQKMYAEGSEERIKIDREVYRVQNELVAATYQYSMDWIEKKKNYNDLTLAEELAAYKRVQRRYAQGSETREKLDLKVYQLEKEIAEAQKQYIEDIQSAQEEANQKRIELEEEYADKVKSINEQLESDIASLNKEYEDAVKSRADTLYKSYGLFDEVSERKEVDSSTLITNMKNQVEELIDYSNALNTLSERGLDSALIEELREMGVKSVAEMEALASATDEQLETLEKLWRIKHSTANEIAADELEDLHDQTQESIEKLREDAAKELDEYTSTWQTEMEQLNTDTAAKLEELRKTFAEKVGIIKTDTQAEMQEMSETAQKILTDAGWDATGQQIVQGLIDGVESSKSSFLDEITNMALASVEAVKTTLDINSPSRVFRELGNYTGLGFIKGLHDYIHNSYEAGSDIATSAKTGLSGALQTFAGLVDDVLDAEPVIRPVLDLSDITTGAGAMNTLLSSGASLRLASGAASTFGLNQGVTQTINVDNDGVVSELRSLRGEMNHMTERIEKLRVVMNTGALVGELVDPMDTALGQKAMLRGRGN